jgi:cellobiose phosphorylase
VLSNAYGQFDSSGKSFIITDPQTPTPWVNIVCNGRYGFVVSQNGGGFSWLDNSQLNALTRWEMDLARDRHGKLMFLSDLETGAVWSAAPTPCRPDYDSFQCEHTQGLTRFTSQCNGLRVVWTMSVAPTDPVELWTVEITNLEPRKRRLRIASYLDWCCGVAPDAKREFHRLFFTTRYDPARRAIVVEKNMWDVPTRHEAEHWNRPWPYIAAHTIGGAAIDREIALADKTSFFGRYGDAARPAAMSGDGAFHLDATAFGRFGDAAASLGGDISLGPSETIKLHFTLAIAENAAGLEALVDKYSNEETVEEAIRQTVTDWEALLFPTRVGTLAPDLDLLCNHWLPYQAISGRLWGRTGYYQQSGAFGFRDQLQDSQVWLTLDPKRCLDQILLHAAHQFADGSVYHWWHPLVETGLRTACSDDYLWLPFILSTYIKDTGDFAALQRTAPFVDDPNPTTLLEHCRRAISRSFSRHSPRGLPLIGSCDWNDGLSAVGVKEKGESVWLAMFVIRLLDDFGECCRRAGQSDLAAEYGTKREALINAVNEHAWDGSWFRGATLDSGEWIGSHTNAAGRIFLNCQTWAVLSECTSPDRLAAAWDSVKQYLLTEWGPLLIAPAYTEPRADIGYITRYSPGSRENGGVYMHAATWALAAACKMRDVEAVGRIWKSISPPMRGADAEGYRAEPYVTPGNVDGPLSDTPGRAGWTWYTGSAAWLRKVALDWMLGIRASWEGLEIDPCPPAELGVVNVTRLWRGRSVRVRFDSRSFDPNQRPLLTINGIQAARSVLTENDWTSGTMLDVEVSWDQEKAAAHTHSSRRIKV